MFDVLRPDVALVGTEVVKGGGHVASVPESDGVDDEPEGAELVLLALAVRLAQFAAVAVKDKPVGKKGLTLNAGRGSGQLTV